MVELIFGQGCGSVVVVGQMELEELGNVLGKRHKENETDVLKRRGTMSKRVAYGFVSGNRWNASDNGCYFYDCQSMPERDPWTLKPFRTEVGKVNTHTFFTEAKV